jgi:hypothetical protein
MKKALAAISIITSLISLLYLCLSYKGIIRYSELYVKSPKKYENDYKKLKYFDKNKRVVVSLAPSLKDLKNIESVIKSLLNQTVKVNLISITLPYGDKYKIPLNIKDSVAVYRTNTDYGDLNAIIPTAIREGEANTQLIVLGADKIYGENFIEEILEKSKENPDNIIYCNNKENKCCIKQGILFPINIFSEDFFNCPKSIDGDEWTNKIFSNKTKTRIKYNLNYKKI